MTLPRYHPITTNRIMTISELFIDGIVSLEGMETLGRAKVGGLVDGHNLTFGDCQHYCMPGIPNQMARAISMMLTSVLSDDGKNDNSGDGGYHPGRFGALFGNRENESAAVARARISAGISIARGPGIGVGMGAKGHIRGSSPKGGGLTPGVEAAGANGKRLAKSAVALVLLLTGISAVLVFAYRRGRRVVFDHPRGGYRD